MSTKWRKSSALETSTEKTRPFWAIRVYPCMIARMWHGWTKPPNADAYESLLRDEMFPEIRRIEGSQGAYLLRRRVGEEVEFVTITLFSSLEAVRRFAGEDYETAVLHPKAHALLARYDAKSLHYEVRIRPDEG